MNLAPHARTIAQAADAILAFSAWHAAGRRGRQPPTAESIISAYTADRILWGALCDAATAEAFRRGYKPPEFYRQGRAEVEYEPRRSQRRRPQRVG